MARAVDTFAPLGLPEYVRTAMGDRTEAQFLSSFDDGRWLCYALARLGLPPRELAGFLVQAVGRPDLLSWVETATAKQARRKARELRKEAASKSLTGEQRRKRYAGYCIIAAALHPDDRERGAYAHAAVAYSGVDPATVADTLRATVPWSRVQGGIDGGALERIAERAATESSEPAR